MRALALTLAALLAGCATEPEPPHEPASATPTLPTEPDEPTLSLVSAGAMSNGSKTYTISSTSNGLYWGHLAVFVDGAALGWTNATACPTPPPTSWTACANGATLSLDREVAAGHHLVVTGNEGQELAVRTTSGKALVGLRLR